MLYSYSRHNSFQLPIRLVSDHVTMLFFPQTIAVALLLLMLSPFVVPAPLLRSMRGNRREEEEIVESREVEETGTEERTRRTERRAQAQTNRFVCLYSVSVVLNDLFEMLLQLEQFFAVLFLLLLVSKKKAQAKQQSATSRSSSSKRNETYENSVNVEMSLTVTVAAEGREAATSVTQARSTITISESTTDEDEA